MPAATRLVLGTADPLPVAPPPSSTLVGDEPATVRSCLLPIAHMAGIVVAGPAGTGTGQRLRRLNTTANALTAAATDVRRHEVGLNDTCLKLVSENIKG